MQLLYYSNGHDPAHRRLKAAIHRAVPESQIESFTKLEGFSQRIRKPIEPDSIAVLSASSRAELQQMQPLRGLLPEIYVVLVIPDRSKRTIELAHLLLPRFLSEKGSDFADLIIVLNKMYLNSQPSELGRYQVSRRRTAL